MTDSLQDAIARNRARQVTPRPCPKCGQTFNVDNDVRLVNARAPQPYLLDSATCSACLQVLRSPALRSQPEQVTRGEE